MKKAYVEIGNRCYCRCPMCDIHSKPHPRMKLQLFKHIVDQLIDADFERIRLAGYEPMTHPDFRECVAYIVDNTIQTEITTTLVSPNEVDTKFIIMIDDVNISLSVAGREEYKEFYSVDLWDRFLENFKIFLKHRMTPFTIVYTITRGNSSIEDFTKFTHFINAYNHTELNVVFFPMIDYEHPWSDVEISSVLTNFRHAYEKYYKNIFINDFSGQPVSVCTIPKIEWYIKWNCDIYPCCLAGGEIGQHLLKELCLGNIIMDGIKTILERSTHPITDIHNRICQKCSHKYIEKMRRM